MSKLQAQPLPWLHSCIVLGITRIHLGQHPEVSYQQLSPPIPPCPQSGSPASIPLPGLGAPRLCLSFFLTVGKMIPKISFVSHLCSSVHLCVPGRGGSRTFFDCNIMTSEVRDGAEEGWRKAGGRKSLLCDSRPSLASLERWSISPCSGPCCLCEAEWCI